VFRGSTVRSHTNDTIWLADAFGRGEKRDITRDILNEVLDIQAHE